MKEVSGNQVSGVYGIKNTVTGKFYVGSSGNVHNRWMEHRRKLRREKHHSVHLQNSWNKYGEAAFIFGIIEAVEGDELLQQTEQYHIDTWDTVNNGYNICSTAGSCKGRKGRKLSPETCAKMSATRKGKKHSPETCAKISAAGKGRILSPESIEKGASARRGARRSPEVRARLSAALTGRKFTEEHRAKMSVAGKGRILSPESIKKGAAARRGSKHSPETRARMSAARKAWHESRRLLKESNAESKACQPK
jgi:group I intron endonuclease